RPQSTVRKLVTRLRAQLDTADQFIAVSDAPAETSPPRIATPAAAVAPAGRLTPIGTDRGAVHVRSKRYLVWAALGVAIVAVVLNGVRLARAPSALAGEARLPVVAVTAIDDVRGDSSVNWLRAGLLRLIA